MNKEQFDVFQDVMAGRNILLSSPGGSGKSYVLKSIIDELNITGKNFQVTATSGRAAALLGGLSIHRFLRIIPTCTTLQDYVTEFRTKRTAQIFRNLNILIIDEVGMMTSSFFELISEILDYERETGMPFGGLQIIMVGDLLQLGPINSPAHSNDSTAIFNTSIWKALMPKVHQLTKNMRQTDEPFVSLLNRIRLGTIDEEVKSMLKEAQLATPDPQRRYVHIFARNVDKDVANATYLDNIHGTTRTFHAQDRIMEDGLAKDIDSIGEKTLVLKRGVNVMLLRNMAFPHQDLTLGTLGELVGFSSDGLPLVRFGTRLTIEIRQYEWQVHRRNANGQMKVVASRTQIPLVIGHALTLYKVQGFTLENAIVHCKGMFTHGQFYTAISRIRTKDGFILRDYQPSCIKTDSRYVEYYQKCGSSR